MRGTLTTYVIELAEVLQDLRRPSLQRASALGFDRCLCHDHPRSSLPSRIPRELRRDGAADSGRASKIQGLSEGFRRLGRNAARIGDIAALR